MQGEVQRDGLRGGLGVGDERHAIEVGDLGAGVERAGGIAGGHGGAAVVQRALRGGGQGEGHIIEGDIGIGLGLAGVAAGLSDLVHEVGEVALRELDGLTGHTVVVDVVVLLVDGELAAIVTTIGILGNEPQRALAAHKVGVSQIVEGAAIILRTGQCPVRLGRLIGGAENVIAGETAGDLNIIAVGVAVGDRLGILVFIGGRLRLDRNVESDGISAVCSVDRSGEGRRTERAAGDIVGRGAVGGLRHGAVALSGNTVDVVDAGYRNIDTGGGKSSARIPSERSRVIRRGRTGLNGGRDGIRRSAVVDGVEKFVILALISDRNRNSCLTGSATGGHFTVAVNRGNACVRRLISEGISTRHISNAVSFQIRVRNFSPFLLIAAAINKDFAGIGGRFIISRGIFILRDSERGRTCGRRCTAFLGNTIHIIVFAACICCGRLDFPSAVLLLNNSNTNGITIKCNRPIVANIGAGSVDIVRSGVGQRLAIYDI